MLTRISQKLISLFLVLCLFAILFGNLVLLALSLIPLFFIILGLTSDPVSSVNVSRAVERSEVFVNEEMEVRLDVELGEGSGSVLLVDKVPDEFKIVEGSNFKVFSKGGEEGELRYKVKCTKRGEYELGPVSWESRHILNMKQVETGFIEDVKSLRVKPRLLNPRKVRGGTKQTPIPLPSGSISKFGIPTMDFKELREYTPGDSFKKINWKATARASTGDESELMVNEYEKEGREQVWIFLDQSENMDLGKTTANIYEYALDAANSLSHYYLNKGCMVGFVPYNSKSSFVHPDTGKKQHLTILEKILKLNKQRDRDGDGRGNDLKSSVSESRPYMAGFSPFFVIITRITEKNKEEIREGIKEISKGVNIDRRKNLPIMLVNVSGYGFSEVSDEESIANEFLKIEDTVMLKDLKNHIFWVEWSPYQESFTQSLLRGVTRG